MTWQVVRIHDPAAVTHIEGYARITVPLKPGEYEYTITIPASEPKEKHVVKCYEKDTWVERLGGHHHHACHHEHHHHHHHAHNHCRHHTRCINISIEAEAEVVAT
ncbi:hypothetical protein GQ54DRAFT_295093 [Martensiomyces pterosporus]|nr:hypothetical protein GQ54DRAFT_295093 [Martensiomyces pterosporus]